MDDVFDLSLTDEYIFNLDFDSTKTLIGEAVRFQNAMEKEVTDLVLGGESSAWGIPAVKMSLEPLLFQAEIDHNPKFLGKLKTAEELSAKAGRAEAIQYTAELHMKTLEADYHG